MRYYAVLQHSKNHTSFVLNKNYVLISDLLEYTLPPYPFCSVWRPRLLEGKVPEEIRRLNVLRDIINKKKVSVTVIGLLSLVH